MGSKIQSTGERNNSTISCSSDFHAFHGTISLTSQEPIWIYTCAKTRQENLTLGVEYHVHKWVLYLQESPHLQRWTAVAINQDSLDQPLELHPDDPFKIYKGNVLEIKIYLHVLGDTFCWRKIS